MNQGNSYAWMASRERRRSLLMAIALAVTCAINTACGFHGTARAQSTPTAPDMAPLDVSFGGWPIIGVSIGGKRYTGMLDSGAETTIDKQVATDQRLSQNRGRTIANVHNDIEVTARADTPITLLVRGRFPVRINNVEIADLNGNPDTRLPFHFDLLLGSEFFAEYAVAIDYVKHAVTVLSKSVAKNSCARTSYSGSIAFLPAGRAVRPVVKGSVGWSSGTFFLDTGSARTVVNRKGAADLNLPEFTQYVTAYPINHMPPYPISRLFVGSFPSRNSYIWFTDERISLAADGRFGSSAFVGTTLIIDEPARLYCIVPSRSPT